MSKEVMHHIKANLYPNKLTDAANKFVARTSSERCLNTKEICQTAISRGGASGNVLVMEQYVNAFLKEWAYQLCDGYSVNTGYFTANMCIRGVFEHPAEHFDTSRHSVYFQLNQGDLLRKMRPEIKVDILGLADVFPDILQVYDVKSGSVNNLITPGKVLMVSGSRIRVTGDDPQTGIFFVSEDTAERIKVPAEEIVRNNPKEVMLMVPVLDAGIYHLEIVTQYCNGSALLKTPRTGTLDKALTVH